MASSFPGPVSLLATFKATGTGKMIIVKQLILKASRDDDKACQQELMEFQREASKLCDLRHVNIVQYLFYCERSRTVPAIPACIGMEYLGDTTLGVAALETDVTLLQRLGWLREVASGLCYAHSLSPATAHCDVKPNNVMIYAQPNPAPRIAKIIDFGKCISQLLLLQVQRLGSFRAHRRKRPE